MNLYIINNVTRFESICQGCGMKDNDNSVIPILLFATIMIIK